MLYNINDINFEGLYIIYLRKSRSDNPDQSVEEVLEKHEEQLQEFAEAELGYKIPEEHIFREVVSGETIADRPVMRQIMQLLETGNVKGVIVIEPQRLSRGDLEDCGKIVNVFRYTNTKVMTPGKTYNIDEEYDRKFFEMELTRGNEYLEYTKKILNRGRIASAKRGNFIGQYAPYGYKKVKIGEGKDACYSLEIVPEEAEALKLMYHLFINEGYGFTKIATHLDNVGAKPRRSEKWSPAAIKDMIENPVHTGKIRWNYRKTVKKIVDGQIVKSRPNSSEKEWILVEGKHKAIIDEETYQKAMDKRGKVPKLKKYTECRNPFAGLLFCSTCGRAMSQKKYINKRNVGNSECITMICNNQRNCKTKSVMYYPFLERVIQSLESTIQDFTFKIENNDGDAAKIHVAMIKNLQEELKKLREKDNRQKDSFDDGIYTKEEYLSRNAKVQEQISEVKEAICVAQQSVPAVVNYEEKLMKFSDCLNALTDDDVPAIQKNILLKECIEKIVYTNNMESKRGIGRFVENKFELDIFLRL